MSEDRCLCYQHSSASPGFYTCSKCGRAWFTPQPLGVSVHGDIKGKYVLRVTPAEEQHPMMQPITPVRIVSVEDCICGQGPVFCSCTRCRGCNQVIDGAAGQSYGIPHFAATRDPERHHSCSGMRELTQQERQSWECTSVNPKTGSKCEGHGTHSYHFTGGGLDPLHPGEHWLNDWEQPQQMEQLEDSTAVLPNVRMADDKKLSDLGGLLSEVIWEQRQMQQRSLNKK